MRSIRINYISNIILHYDGPSVKEQIKNFIFTTVFGVEKIKGFCIFSPKNGRENKKFFLTLDLSYYTASYMDHTPCSN